MNHYEVLGVDRHASADIIKAAYRVQAKKYHPDLTANDPRSQQLMQRVNEAYAVLADPQKRRNYDLTLRDPEPEPSVVYSRTTQPDTSYDDRPPTKQKRRAGGGVVALLILLALALTGGLFYLFFAYVRYMLFS